MEGEVIPAGQSLPEKVDGRKDNRWSVEATTKPRTKKTEKELTKQQIDFSHYVVRDGMTQADAYRLAYDKQDWPQEKCIMLGHKVATGGLVKTYIAALREQTMVKVLGKFEVTEERIVGEICRIAYCNPKDFYDDEGRLKDPKDWTEDMSRAVSSIETTELFDGKGESRVAYGQIRKIRFHDKTANLHKLLDKLETLFKDRKTLFGSTNINVAGNLNVLSISGTPGNLAEIRGVVEGLQNGYRPLVCDPPSLQDGLVVPAAVRPVEEARPGSPVAGGAVQGSGDQPGREP